MPLQETPSRPASALPRGIRNDNPGNIRRNSRHAVWQGEVWPGHDESFCTFNSPQMGIRAICLTLRSYATHDGCKTMGAAVRRWAPPSENNTSEYIAFVIGRTRLQAWSVFDPGDWATMRSLVAALIAEECDDYAYPDDILDQGLALAGLHKPTLTTLVS